MQQAVTPSKPSVVGMDMHTKPSNQLTNDLWRHAKWQSHRIIVGWSLRYIYQEMKQTVKSLDGGGGDGGDGDGGGGDDAFFR